MTSKPAKKKPARLGRPGAADRCRIEARRLEVSRLHIEGFQASEIAHRLGIAKHTVSSDLAILRKRWDGDGPEENKLAHLERELWAAWHRSCEPAADKGTPRDGDPRFLEAIERVVRLQLSAGPEPRQAVQFLPGGPLVLLTRGEIAGLLGLPAEGD